MTDTEAVFRQVEASIKAVGGLLSDIAAAAQSQAAGIAQLNSGTTQMGQVVHENHQDASDTADLAMHMEDEARAMKGIVDALDNWVDENVIFANTIEDAPVAGPMVTRENAC